MNATNDLQTFICRSKLASDEPGSHATLWVRKRHLLSRNRFIDQNETLAVWTHRSRNGKNETIEFRQAASPAPLAPTDQEPGLRGQIDSRGHRLQWDLSAEPMLKVPPRESAIFSPWVDPSAAADHRLPHWIETWAGPPLRWKNPLVRIRGSVKIDDHEIILQDALAQNLERRAHAFPAHWDWLSCDRFEGIETGSCWVGAYTMLPRFWMRGPLRSKARRLGFIAWYEGRWWWADSWRHPLRVRAHVGNEWNLEAECGPFLFRLESKLDPPIAPDWSTEDSDGSQIKISMGIQAKTTLHVFRSGKRQATLNTSPEWGAIWERARRRG